MAKQKSGNKVWIAGAIMGAVAGAAYALWKTPMSGEELRGKLSTGPVGQSDSVKTDTVHTPNAGDTILGKIEQTLAPIVGVQLGKTANGPAPTNGTVTEPIKVATPPSEAADAADAPAAAATSTTEYSGDSFRTRRYEWGTPAPESTETPAAVQANATPEPAAPIVEEVVEKVQSSDAAAASAGYGTDSIRTKQFRWGEPAPEAASTEGAAATSVAVEEPTASLPATDQKATAPETTSPVQPVSAAAADGNGKRQFPKLGGLES